MKSVFVAAFAATALVAGVAAADQFDAVLGARQGYMKLIGFNMAPLGAMAKGEMPYDAEKAKTHAANLAMLAQISQVGFWPKGTDNVALKDRTAALPAIWDANSKVGEKSAAFKTAMANLGKEAGNGLDALKAAISDAGKSCGGCHSDYRQKQN